MRAVLGSDNIDVIRDSMAALSKGTEEFAARRMNRSIRNALSGKNVDDVNSIL